MKAQPSNNHPQLRPLRNSMTHRLTAIAASTKFEKYKIAAIIPSLVIASQFEALRLFALSLVRSYSHRERNLPAISFSLSPQRGEGRGEGWDRP
jgi:hypothetical protein